MCRKTESVLDSRMVYAFSFIDGHHNAKGKANRLTCCSGRIDGGNWPVAKVRSSRETCKSSERCMGRYHVHHSHQPIIARQLGRDMATHLSYDEVFRELGKADDSMRNRAYREKGITILAVRCDARV